MRKLCLQFISAFVTLNPKCRKAVPVFILAFALSSICYTGFAQVVITPAAGGANICSSTALAGGSPSSCTTLGSITITETNNNDFPPGSSTIVLNPPTGWQFCTGTTPVATFLPGQDISTVTVTPPPFTSTSLTINVTTTGITHHDAITITGLMVQPLTTSAPPGYIYATSVTGAIVGISTGPGPGTSDFGDLSEIPGNISGTPSVCFGFTDTLTSCPAGGIWASSNGAVATVLAGTGCTAVVTSHSAGAITITHTVLGCSTTLNFNVYSNPPPITGLHPHMCAWYDTLTAMDSLGGTGGIFSST